MPLVLTDGQRPSEALQHAMGRAQPALSDEQCVEFYDLVEDAGGMPSGAPEAQRIFAERYEADVAKGRWVKRGT